MPYHETNTPLRPPDTTREMRCTGPGTAGKIKNARVAVWPMEDHDGEPLLLVKLKRLQDRATRLVSTCTFTMSEGGANALAQCLINTSLKMPPGASGYCVKIEAEPTGEEPT